MNKVTYLYPAIRVRTFYVCLTTLLLMVVPFRLTSAAPLDLVLPSQAPSQVYKNKGIIEITQNEARESALIGLEWCSSSASGGTGYSSASGGTGYSSARCS